MDPLRCTARSLFHVYDLVKRNLARRLTAFVLCALFSSNVAYGQYQFAPAHSTSVRPAGPEPSSSPVEPLINTGGGTGEAHPGQLNLNLSSTARNLVAPTHIGDQTVSIITGNALRSITSESSLTPAERVAVWQVLNSGRQSLRLGPLGNAVSGQMTIGTWLNKTISDLVIPRGVTVFSHVDSVNIANDLVNSGRMNIQPALAASALISATNIINNPGAFILSSVPLQLIASQNVVNSGVVHSANSLSIAAGGSIVNALPLNAMAANPSMTAATNVNLITNTLVNSGRIAAMNGNVNLSSQAPGNITVENRGGTISALQGAFNVRDPAFTGKYNFSMHGGDILSKEMNIWSGNGTANVNVENITGMVNIDAGAAHVLSNAPNLNLGVMNITGDPTYFNHGNITVSGAIGVAGEDLAIVATGDITSAASSSITTTNTSSSGPANGGNVLIVAGAQFTATGPDSPSTPDTTSTVTITGGTTTGGQINFNANPITITTHGASTTSTRGPGNGGSVTLVAFGGSSQTSGVINLGSTGSISTIGGNNPDTSPETWGNNGNVIMIAGATGGNSISTGAVDTSGSLAGGPGQAGQIILLAATPTVQSPISILSGTASGSFGVGQMQPATITVNGALNTNFAPITIASGGPVSLAAPIHTNGTYLVNGTLGGSQVAANLAIFAGGDITATAAASAISTAAPASPAYTLAGGDMYIAAGVVVNSSLSLQLGSVQGITMQLNLTGASATGGQINFSNSALSTSGGSVPTSTPPGQLTYVEPLGLAGGNLSLVSFGGSGTNAGTINLGTSIITTGGTSNGSSSPGTPIPNPNGDVTILAGASSGTSITANTINTSGSTAGAGNITIMTAAATVGLPLSYQVSAAPSGHALGSLTVNGSLSPGTIQPASIALSGNLVTAGGSTSLAPTGASQGLFATTTITVQAGQNLTLGTTANPLSITNSSNSMVNNDEELPTSFMNFSAAGAINFAGSVITISSEAVSNATAGVNGGTISLSAGSFSFALTTAVNISSDGTNGFNATTMTGGSGGTISISTTGNTATSTINVGVLNGTPTSTGVFTSISALGGFTTSGGGNGGKLSIVSGGSINLNPAVVTLNPAAGANSLPNFGTSASSASGYGATILLDASKNFSSDCSTGCVFLLNTLDASGAQSTVGLASNNPGGSGGSETIYVNSSVAFNIGSAPTTPVAPQKGSNGVANNGILSANGNTKASGATAAFGNGGSITVRNLGGQITVQANGSNTNVPGATAGIEVQAADATESGNKYPAGDGGRIVLQAPSSAVLSMGGLDASGGSASTGQPGGDGGSIEIYTSSSNSFTIGGGNTILNGVMGSVTARGDIGNNSSNSVPTGADSVPLLYNKGSGGTITISNGPATGTGGITVLGGTANLSVAAAHANHLLHSAAGDGGFITLWAPVGPVYSNMSLNADGGGYDTPTYTTTSTTLTAATSPLQANAQTITFQTAGVAANFFVGQEVLIADSQGSTVQEGQFVTAVNPTSGCNCITVGHVANNYTTPIVGPYFSVSQQANSTLTASANPVTINFTGTNTTNGFYVGQQVQISSTNTGTQEDQYITAVTSTSITVSKLSNSYTTNPAVNAYYSNGNGGTIRIVSMGQSPFTVSGASSLPSGNGVNGTLSANGYSGGHISLREEASGIVINSINSATVTTSNPFGVGISVASLTPNAGDQNQLSTGGSGGFISLEAKSGPVTVNGSLDVSGSSGSFRPTYANQGPSTGGRGGTILISANGSGNPIIIGSNTSNSWVQNMLRADGGFGTTANGPAGTVTVVNFSGGITVNQSTVNNTGLSTYAYGATEGLGSAGAPVIPGDGGSISLQAPSGPVVLNGNLNANGGAAASIFNIYTSPGLAGSISITANNDSTSQALTISAGQLSATGWNGGSISVTNNGTKGLIVDNSTTTNLAINVQATAAATTARTMGILSAPQSGGVTRIDGGSGGSITLQAPNGPVIVKGDLNVNGGDGTTGLSALSSAGTTGNSSVVITLDTSTTCPTCNTFTPNPGFLVGETIKVYGAVAAQQGAGFVFEQETAQISAVSSDGTTITVSSLQNVYLSTTSTTNPGAPKISLSIITPVLEQSSSAPTSDTISFTTNPGFLPGNAVLIQGPINGGIAQEIQVVSTSASGQITLPTLTNSYTGAVTVSSALALTSTNNPAHEVPPLSGAAPPVPIQFAVQPSLYANETIIISGPTAGGPATEIQTINLVPDSITKQVYMYNVNNTYTGPVTVQAVVGGGSGGQISIVSNTSSNTPFTIGTGTTPTNGVQGSIRADAGFAGSSGGNIFITNLGADGISASDSTKLSATAGPATSIAPGGNGGSIYLNALGTGGSIFIGGAMNANGAIGITTTTSNGTDTFTSISSPGSGGTIALTVNTSTPSAFTVGGTPSANGIAGNLSAFGYNGGSIGVKNLGSGGVTLNDPTNIILTALDVVGGTLDLEAPNGTLTFNGSGAISADGQFLGGTISLNASTISASSPITFSANAVDVGTGGSIFVTQSSGTLTVGSASNLILDVTGSLLNGTVLLTAPAGLTINGTLTASTVGISTSTGSGNISMTGTSPSITADVLNLTTGSGTATLTTAISNSLQVPGGLTFTGGGGQITLTNTGDLWINTSSQFNGDGAISISNTGNLDVLGTISTTGPLSLTTSGNISIAPASGNIYVGGLKSLTLSAGGSITTSNATLLGRGAGIFLTAGTGGMTVSTSTNTLTVTQTTADAVEITNFGSLTFSLGNGTVSTFPTLTISNSLGSLTLDGNITQPTSIILNVSVAPLVQAPYGNYSTILNGNLGAGTASSSVQISTAGSIVQASGMSVDAETINLFSQNGNLGIPDILGTGGIPLNISHASGAGALTVTTVNAGAAYITDSSTSGITLSGVQTAGDFQLLTAGGITVSSSASVVSNYGSIKLQNQTSGDITLNGNVTANGGPVIIENDNTGGSMTVGSNVTVTGYARVFDQNPPTPTSNTDAANLLLAGVIFSSGSPVLPSQGSVPQTGVTFNINGTLQTTAPTSAPFGAFFGPGVSATSSTVNVNYPGGNNPAGTVLFNGNSSSSITLDSGSTVNANGVILAISTLDLTANGQSAVAGKTMAQALADMQCPTCAVSGTLTVSGGAATGGNVIFDQSVARISFVDLKGINIPQNVTVQFSNFNHNNPVVVNIPSTATTNGSISGIAQFVGAGNFASNGGLYVNSNIPAATNPPAPPPAPWTVLSLTGSLTSDNSISVIVGGSIGVSLNIAGTLTAGANATANTASALQIFTGTVNQLTQTNLFTVPPGSMQLSGTLQSGFGTTASSGNGSITILSGGGITQTAGSITASQVTLQVSGANSSPNGNSLITANAINAGTLNINGGSAASLSTVNQKSGFSVGTLNVNVYKFPFQLTQTPSFNLSATSIGNLLVNSSTGIVIAGVTCGSCTFTAPSLTFKSGASIISSNPEGSIAINAPAGSGLTLTGVSGGGSTVQSNIGLTITSNGAATLANIAFSNASGQLNLTSSGAITLTSVSMTAGTQTNYFGGLISPANILQSGSVTLSSTGTTANQGAITVDAGSYFQTYNGNITVTTASNSLVTLSGLMEADGGSIGIGTLGNIYGNTPVFTANAIGTMSTNSVGGGIQMSVGQALNPALLAAAFTNYAPGTVAANLSAGPTFIQPSGTTQVMGRNTVINNGNFLNINASTGVVVQNQGSLARVNLSTTAKVEPYTPPRATDVPAILTLSGGAINFDTQGISDIKLGGATLTVRAFTPIVYEQADEDIPFASEPDSGRNGAGCCGNLANIFLDSGSSEKVQMEYSGKLAGSSSGNVTAAANASSSTIKMKSGSAFVNPLTDVKVLTFFGDVHVRKGALASIVLEHDSLRVAACSGPGHTIVHAGGRRIDLSPGEEVVISDHSLNSDEQLKADGIGRRRFHEFELGAGLFATTCEVSVPGMLFNCEHMRALKHPRTALERRIAGDLIKNAAALMVVTQGHGPYRTRSNENRDTDDARMYTPVRYVQ